MAKSRGFRPVRYGVMVFVSAVLALSALLFASGCSQAEVAEGQFRPFLMQALERTDEQTTTDSENRPFRQRIYETGENRFGSSLNVGGYEYLLGESMSAQMDLVQSPLSFDGEPVYSWMQIEGAACARTHLLAIVDDLPTLLLDLDGSLDFYDFDGDGTEEIVVSHIGIMPVRVSVAFWNHEKRGIEILDVNHTLNAQHGVRYEDGCFYAFKHGDGSKHTRYTFDAKVFKKRF